MTHCILIGAPVDEGQRRPGCLMGPAAYRVAGLARTLADLGHTVEDFLHVSGMRKSIRNRKAENIPAFLFSLYTTATI